MNINTQRIFCIGRNYIDHAKELNNKLPITPVVFIKPISCLVPQNENIKFPKHGKNLHHEVELVFRIGKSGSPISVDDAFSFISDYTLGIDLTLRDVQDELKNKGLPWEMAKAFEQSAPIGTFKKYEQESLNNIYFRCLVNGVVKQEGYSKDMIFSPEVLIFELGKIWNFQPGDLIYTGTPAGVGPLRSGDIIVAECDRIGSFSWKIVE